MIKQVKLHNFKCFKDETFNLGNLTVMTGVNGVGKSTLIQSLLLLNQSYMLMIFQLKKLMVIIL